MMATTHAMWGMTLGLPVLAMAPELAPIALAAGLVGGFLPDMDLYAGHRKTLHYPFVAPLLAITCIAVAILYPTGITVALAVGVAAAALHAISDIFGGGLELRPWEATSDRGVYSHLHGRWLSPRRTIRYDGSPEDLGLAGLAAVPLLVIGSEVLQVLVLGLLLISAVYVFLRRRLADLASRLAGYVPHPYTGYVPHRYRPN